MKIENNEGYFRTMSGLGKPLLWFIGVPMVLYAITHYFGGWFTGLLIIGLILYFVVKQWIKEDRNWTKNNGEL